MSFSELVSAVWRSSTINSSIHPHLLIYRIDEEVGGDVTTPALLPTDVARVPDPPDTSPTQFEMASSNDTVRHRRSDAANGTSYDSVLARRPRSPNASENVYAEASTGRLQDGIGHTTSEKELCEHQATGSERMSVSSFVGSFFHVFHANN